MRLPTTLLCLAMTLALSACGNDAATDTAATPDPAMPATADAPPPAPMTDPAADTSMPAAAAMATLAATEGNTAGGELRFEADNGGVRISGQVSGLTAGREHGFHVHETGDCSAPDATSAGGHFNPADTAHGRVGAGEHHAGDTNNLTADGQGMATVDARLEGATLGDGSATDVIGRGVIVHADPDDYATQPTGNAGGRLACGVIEAAM